MTFTGRTFHETCQANSCRLIAVSAQLTKQSQIAGFLHSSLFKIEEYSSAEYYLNNLIIAVFHNKSY